jgi:hypothetical protein
MDYTHFTFHELKKKGVTAVIGNAYDKIEASGHRSHSMKRFMIFLTPRVKPTRED